MQRVITAPRQFAIDRNQVLDRRYFGRENDFRARQTDLFGPRRRKQGRLHHGLACDVTGIDRMIGTGVFVHQMRQQFLIQRAPVRANAHRLVVTDGGFDDGAAIHHCHALRHVPHHRQVVRDEKIA